MRQRHMGAASRMLVLLSLAVSVCAVSWGRTQTDMQTATLKATLVDAENKAKKKEATVEVKVTGLELIDPAKVNEMSKKGQSHIHYQVDDGPIIATTTTKLSFHGLTPGPHKIVVMLANNDHTPLGPQETLNVTVP
jgi:Family of unknown function (DUF6130)